MAVWNRTQISYNYLFTPRRGCRVLLDKEPPTLRGVFLFGGIMGGYRKTIEDYRLLAKSKGFIWVADVLPKTIQHKTVWRCDKGHTFSAGYFDLNRVSGCPDCRKRLTAEDYRAIVENRDIAWIATEIPVTCEYKTLWKCLKCERVWEATYHNIKKGKGCRGCYFTSMRHTEADYHNLATSRGFLWADDRLPDGVKLETKWQCLTCHSIISKTYNGLQKRGCQVCYDRSIRVTEDDYRALAQSKAVEWIGETLPESVKHKTKWKCLTCGRERYTKYDTIRNGSGCEHCRQSRGEWVISQILDGLGIKYFTEKRFDDCRDKRTLPFDFYFELNGFQVLIEFQGVQHYQTVKGDYFGTQKELQTLQRHDAIKADYAQEKGMRLLVIPYLEINSLAEIVTDWITGNLMQTEAPLVNGS